ncbi:CinA family protein, partial [Salmonella enterica]|uniref:CinA family protein n=1 Tax=Salmonella enterica TaxID=28901 RepID=UPI003D2674BC
RLNLVTYANAEKTRLLGVSPDLLAAEGAVSAAVAEAMAIGARAFGAADWGVGITGIAGPSGGTDEKPVGLAYVAVAGPEGPVRSEHVRVNGR